MKSKGNRFTTAFGLWFSTAPLLSYAGVVALAVYTYASLGHWPKYSTPDPKTLGWLIRLPVDPLLILTPFAVFLAPITLFFTTARQSLVEKRRSSLVFRDIIVFFGLYVIGISAWLQDWANVTEWIVD